MVNKKGYIKTLEAVIAIILIIVVSYTLISQHVETPPEPPLIVQGAMRFINEKIEFDEGVRNDVVKDLPGAKGKIQLIIEENRPRGYSFTCKICPDVNCYVDPLATYKKSIYVSDIFIASSEKKQNPKVVRIWFLKSPITEDDFITEDGYANFGDYENKCTD